MRVLTWNLYHGRSRPAAGRGLLAEFAAALAGWAWDVALLQEVPPWWPPALAAAAGAQERTQLTSRNLGLPLRRALAARNPELLKANGGGANAILVRGAIAEHRAQRLAWWPERRWAHGVRLENGTWAVNLHATTRNEPRAQVECAVAAAVARDWAGDAPLVFGGDLNIHRAPELPGLAHVAGNHVDHLYVAGLAASGPGEVLGRGPLSDHPPVAVSLAVRSPGA
jgi:endonuclease/exonuclease/phosphatase family metal-dependent hydrolase